MAAANGLPGYGGAFNSALIEALMGTYAAMTVVGGPNIKDLQPWTPTAGWLKDWEDPKNLDRAALLARWQPDARIASLGFELGSDLHFEKCSVSVAGGGKAVDGFALQHLAKQADSRFDAIDLVQMSRPTKKCLIEQLELIGKAAERRGNVGGVAQFSNRWTEIQTQVTPPTAFFGALVPLSPDRHPKTLELMHIVQMLAYSAVMRFKQALACARPHELSGAVFPIILTPGHGSFPSGHAAETHTIAYVLGELLEPFLGNARPQLRAMAHRIAENRVIASLHYPVDSIAGQLLGEAMGKYAVARCKGGKVFKHVLSGQDLPDKAAPTSGAVAGDGTQPWTVETQGSSIAKSLQLEWLWKAASAEWDVRDL